MYQIRVFRKKVRIRKSDPEEKKHPIKKVKKANPPKTTPKLTWLTEPGWFDLFFRSYGIIFKIYENLGKFENSDSEKYFS